MRLRSPIVVALVVIALLVVPAGAFQAKTAAKAPTLQTRLDNVVRYFADEDLFAGVVLVARGDELLLNKGYGYANLEWKIPNTPQTVFRIGSLTKQFTAAAVLMLAERAALEKDGDLQLDDPLKKYLPNIPESWNGITLRHLLSHTSGVPIYTQQKKRWAEELSLEQMLDLIRNVPLESRPGEVFKYNNSGYFLLGGVIEKVAGTSYGDFLQENIFTPFGLHNTGFDHFYPLVARHAAGYNRIGLHEFENATYMDMTVPFSAGGLYSTTGDLLRWQHILYGAELFGRDSVTLMTTPGKGNYGFGVYSELDHGHRRFVHSGGINGFNSFLTYYPDDQVSVIVLSNTKALTTRVGDLLAGTVHGDAVNMPATVAVASAKLQNYVGDYGEPAKAASVYLTIQDDRLVVRTGDLVDTLVNESPSRFFDKVTGAELVFSPDGEGAAPGFSLIRNGAEKKYVRMSSATHAATLAGEWESTSRGADGTANVYRFAVNGSTFTGQLYQKEAADRAMPFRDGKIDGNHVSFTVAGQDKQPTGRRYTGTLDGDTLRLFYLDATKPLESTSPKKGGNVHVVTARRVSEQKSGGQ